jgi:hypothetical protein
VTLSGPAAAAAKAADRNAPVPVLVSVNVGMPKNVPWPGKTVPTRWSCRTGVCHTCVTPLLSGDVTYTPSPLEPPDHGEVLICCAQPGTDIVLDM